MSKIKTFLAAIVIMSLFPGFAHSDIVPTGIKQQYEELSPVAYVDKYSQEYQIDQNLFKKVMFCESSNNKNAIGDGGYAKNVMQFHKETFDYYSKQYGQVLDYNSYHDQIKLAMWMFSKGKQNHWTCYKKVMG